MTLRLTRAQVGNDFSARVEAYRQAKFAHHQTVGISAPSEHPLIEAALRRVPGNPDGYVADFEIIEPTLDEQKQDLVVEIGKSEQAALDKILPQGKRRLLSFAIADALTKDEKQRTVADVSVISAWESLGLSDQVIHRHAAKLHAQIDDLTAADIGSWKPEPFPE